MKTIPFEGDCKVSQTKVVVQLKPDDRLLGRDDDNFVLPSYESDYASGMDVRFNPTGITQREFNGRLFDGAIEVHNNVIKGVLLYPRGRALFPTGIRVAIPVGYEIQVRPRSGFALKQGITVLNTPGTIDSDYRGEIGVILYNTSTQAVKINAGDRIAQLVLAPVAKCIWELMGELPVTKRGEGGFSSTGTK